MRRVIVLVLAVGCGGSSQGPTDGNLPIDVATADGAPPADWVLGVGAPVGQVSPNLLGHYELSGSLFDYGANTAAIGKMQAIGFADWRVGVGRWEITTRLLPALADGANTSCAAVLASLPADLQAPAGATDATLLADRDWFTDTGAAVTLADTASDARYALGYVRSVIDTAAAFGAKPYVDLDHMPRALSVNRTIFRGGTVQGVADPCLATWTNHVSNARPADAGVFAAAVVGMVRRVVEGSGTEPARDAPYWEVWNEPELGYAWDQSFEQPPGSLNAFFAMAITTLTQLDAYRSASTAATVKALKFGGGSFASATTAAGVLHAFDTAATPVPLDFLSFHSYSNDPLQILADLQAVSAARAASTHYPQLELVLSEWGPDLAQAPPATAIDTSLLVATVLARAPVLGITRAYHSLFLDFVPPPGLPFTLLAADGTPKPLYHAYELLHDVIGQGADRLAIAGNLDGALDGGQGAVLVTRDPSGVTRALLVNRGTVARTARLELGGAAILPVRVLVFDDPSAAPREVTPSVIVTVPAQAIVVIEH